MFAACCSCCNMRLNEEELSEVPIYQAWIWCTAGTLFWAIWVAFLQKMQADISAEINLRHITAADYTAWVSGLRGTDADDAHIRSFAEHYGQVISAFHVCTVGTVLNINNQVGPLGQVLSANSLHTASGMMLRHQRQPVETNISASDPTCVD